MLMNIFNVIAGFASIAGLIFSIVIAITTGNIQKNLQLKYLAEQFNINHQDLMDNLRSCGLNAVRSEFPEKQLLYDFRHQLISYSKEYGDLFTKEEKLHVQEMLSLLEEIENFSAKDREKYLLLLDQITTKPQIRRL